MRSKILKSRLLLLCTRHGLGTHCRRREPSPRKMIIRCCNAGGLFNLAVRLMQLFSSSDQNFTELTRQITNQNLDQIPFRLLGLYFQIRDDYANLRLPSYAVNKSFAEDLTEGQARSWLLKAISLKSNEKTETVIFAGKFSFPILHCIQSSGKSDDRV